jgi:large subunit ribosomal protein L17
MRHRKKINHLSRTRGHRQAMLSNMAASLIMHKRIKTTTAKAKALKIYIEPLITRAKEDTTHSRRVVFSYLQDKDATSELFRDVAEKIGDRPGGYTRIIKLGSRLGDSAEMCIIELVDYNEAMLAEKAATTKSSRRRRGVKKKSQDASTVAPVGVGKDADKVTPETPAEATEETVEDEAAIETQETGEEVDTEIVNGEKDEKTSGEGETPDASDEKEKKE